MNFDRSGRCRVDRIEKFNTNAGAPQRTIAALALVFRLKQWWEFSMISELANDRLFGLALGAIFVSVLILNAMSY